VQIFQRVTLRRNARSPTRLLEGLTVATPTTRCALRPGRTSSAGIPLAQKMGRRCGTEGSGTFALLALAFVGWTPRHPFYDPMLTVPVSGRAAVPSESLMRPLIKHLAIIGFGIRRASPTMANAMRGFMPNVTKFFDRLFGCRHSNLSRVFTIGRRTYRVCCECGTEFDYSLETMSIQRQRTRLPARHVLREA